MEPQIKLADIRAFLDTIVVDEELLGLPEFVEWLYQGAQQALNDADSYRIADFLFDGGIKEAILEFMGENPNHPKFIELLPSGDPKGSQEGGTNHEAFDYE